MRSLYRKRIRKHFKNLEKSGLSKSYRDLVVQDEGTIVTLDSSEHSVEDLAVLQSHVIPCRIKKVYSDYVEIVTYIKILDDASLPGDDEEALLELTEEEFEEILSRTKIRKYTLNIPLSRLKYFKLSEDENESYTSNDNDLIKVFIEDEKLYEFRKKFMDSNKNFS